MRSISLTHKLLVCFAGVLLAASGCAKAQETPEDPDDNRVPQAVVVENDQELVVPTSVLVFRLKGSSRTVANRAEVEFSGVTGTGREVALVVPLQAEPGEEFLRTDGDQGDILLEVPVREGLWEDVDPRPNANFLGDITVRLVDEIGILATGALETKTYKFRSEVTPTVQTVTGGAIFPNQRIDVAGEHFLRPQEGETRAIVDGVFTYEDPEMAPRMISGESIALEWDGARDRAKVPIDPVVFGVQLGSFEGSLTFENRLSDGTTFPGNKQDSFGFDFQQAFLASISPDAGSRGQKITFHGRGFIPARAELGISMIFEFDGEMVYDDGEQADLTGGSSLQRIPDEVPGEEQALMSVWYEIEGNEIRGLGEKPGTFTGTITPILIGPYGEQEGLSVDTNFRVLPSRQVVHLKYLPGFSKGLEKYGLQNVEFEIRQRILEALTRDYEGVNLSFQEEPVTEFIDYATIEIGGPDPTGGNKFGYDNTCNMQETRCKDTGNLFLADYLGGRNANSADEFNTPFGGVFIESFDYFSPTLNPENDDASPFFDEVLGPFMPALNGTSVKGTEWPDGPRRDEIARAIHMVGSVVANTVSHEIGHSLGLAFYEVDWIRPGGNFHNQIPCENCMMDPGSERPFEERAELNGKGPAKLNERNLNYLKEILPMP